MKVVILEPAQFDLLEGYWFYETQATGVGTKFVQEMKAAIDSLYHTAGIHRCVSGRYHWIISRRFSHAVYYHVEGEVAYVAAVIDCRRSPEWIRTRLGQ